MSKKLDPNKTYNLNIYVNDDNFMLGEIDYFYQFEDKSEANKMIDEILTNDKYADHWCIQLHYELDNIWEDFIRDKCKPIYFK